MRIPAHHVIELCCFLLRVEPAVPVRIVYYFHFGCVIFSFMSFSAPGSSLICIYTSHLCPFTYLTKHQDKDLTRDES